MNASLRQPQTAARHAVRATLIIALAATACWGEDERRAGRIADLRSDAERGLEAARLFCAERDSVLARFQREEPGWEPAVEQLLQASAALDDHCAAGATDEHDHHDGLEGTIEALPADTNREPDPEDSSIRSFY